jgi:hypothetical protein
MTDQERNQVLKMIEEGKISPEEGLHLMQALDQGPVEEVETASQVSASQATIPDVKWKVEQSGMETDPRILKIKSTVQRLWQIPLWIGIGITVLSAVGMYFILRGPGMNFWFYFMIVPLLLGVAIMAAAVGSHKARWIFVDVHQKPGEHPQNIFLGFPLPLKFVAWFMRTFRHWIPSLDREMGNINFDEIIQMFDTGMGTESIIAHVDEGEGGEKVRVFLG